MADTDTLTRIVPQDGWSPIICRRVPITQTITSIVGDKGANEIWQGGSIKNFHAKIDWQDQYSGSRVPADIISESSTDNGENWTMNEVEEHGEGSFELDYEGHERDFEVRLNGTDLYIRYRWMMNGQEIEDADGSYERTITVTDYPVKLEVKAHYADNFGGHEIGTNTFESATVYYKSGATASKTVGQLIKPTQTGNNAVKWADKDGWQSQTWSYTENGRTVTAQIGANITALRDTKIEAEIVEEEVPLTCTLAGSYNYGSTEYKVYETNLSSLPDGDPSAPISAQGVSGVYLQTYEYWTSEGEGSDLSNVILSGNYCVIEVETSDNIDVPSKTWTWFDGSEIKGEASPIFKEGAIVSKSNLLVTMTRNDGSTYEATDYWMSNNYALGRNKQSVTVQKGSLSTTLPVTVAYTTKVEVGNVVSSNFVKSSFYEYGEYVEPTHYKAYYECYDGTEGFDEVVEIDSEWEGKVEEETLGEYGSEVGTLTLGKKSYLYRAGLEPIDEENYLFIHDFKDNLFNYSLVGCYEPQLDL